MMQLLAVPAKHVDSAPFWAGEAIGLVFAGIFVVFVLYVAVQRIRHERKQKDTDR